MFGPKSYLKLVCPASRVQSPNHLFWPKAGGVFVCVTFGDGFLNKQTEVTLGCLLHSFHVEAMACYDIAMTRLLDVVHWFFLTLDESDLDRFLAVQDSIIVN